MSSMEFIKDKFSSWCTENGLEPNESFLSKLSTNEMSDDELKNVSGGMVFLENQKKYYSEDGLPGCERCNSTNVKFVEITVGDQVVGSCLCCKDCNHIWDFKPANKDTIFATFGTGRKLPHNHIS